MDVDSPTPVPKRRPLASPSDSVVEGSQLDGSQFSEKNPLNGAHPSSFGVPVEEKKPQAVALHGWQRTVGVDEDFDPTFPVCLGAPGTGLGAAKVPSAVLGPTIGRAKPREVAPTAAPFGPLGVAPDSWNSVKVTREDKKEAKTLRAFPLAPGAVPLPYPRVVSETDASSDTGTESIDSTARRRLDRRFETQSSTASSDLSFLVNTKAGTFFGTRPTFGRAIEPRIPATVGEERLHNSLTQYFGQNSRREGGGESRSSSGNNSSQDKERSDRGTVSSTPVTRTDTAESSVLGDFPSKAADGSASKVKSITTTTTTAAPAAHIACIAASQESKRGDKRAVGSGTRRRSDGTGATTATAVKAAAKRLNSATSTDQSLEDALDEEERIAKPAATCESERVVPGERMHICGCLRSWPWKVLLGMTMLVAVVAVVVVISAEDAGGKRRLSSSPSSMLPIDSTNWDVPRPTFGHSRRIFSVTGVPVTSFEGLREQPKTAAAVVEQDTSKRRTRLRGRTSNFAISV